MSQHQRALHIVFPHQFLDSPEWFGVSTDDYFQVGVLRQQLHRQQLINQSLRTFVPLRQVSIMAMEESRVLIWHRDKLKLSIMAEPFLQTVFDHILGRDVVKKLMQVTQVSDPGHMCSCIKNFNSERVSVHMYICLLGAATPITHTPSFLESHESPKSLEKWDVDHWQLN